MKKIIFVLLPILFCIMTYAQDSTTYNITKAENKFVYSENTIKLFTGQRISVRANNEAGKLEGIKLLESGETKILDFSKVMINVLQQNGEKNICIDFNVVKQDDKFQTVLIVNNPYKGTLSYKAKVFSRKSNQYIETSIMDVTPGISGIETWPYAISDFILYDFTIKK